MTRQHTVDAKRRPGEETFVVYKFFPAPETLAGVLACGELPDGAIRAACLRHMSKPHADYGPDGTQLCSGSEPFKPAVEFEREIAALVACGYAERCGDMVKWTDKIAPAIWAETSLG